MFVALFLWGVLIFTCFVMAACLATGSADDNTIKYRVLRGETLVAGLPSANELAIVSLPVSGKRRKYIVRGPMNEDDADKVLAKQRRFDTRVIHMSLTGMPMQDYYFLDRGALMAEAEPTPEELARLYSADTSYRFANPERAKLKLVLEDFSLVFVESGDRLTKKIVYGDD